MWGLTFANQNINVEANDYVLSNPMIAYFYANWITSNPFDVGTTVKSALSAL